MTTLTEQASNTFNRVMKAHSINLRASPLDFSLGEQCILPALNQRGEMIANELFDLVFPKLSSGTYFNYMTFGAFEKVMETGNLRLFSTKKLSSEGEFVPLCEDLGLTGYWRKSSDGAVEGEHATLMDDLFYKSFVLSSEENCGELWDTFAESGTGIRVAVKIDVHPEYPDFRQVSYQGSPAVTVLNGLLKAFKEAGRHFIPFGISRMPGYYQLKKWSHHKECRLIAKRHLGAHDCFPFQVSRDEQQKCNFIDCSLTSPTCSAFQLRLDDVVPGPNANPQRKSQITELTRKYKDRQAATIASVTSSTPSPSP